MIPYGTVITPVRNGEPYISETIKSIRAQTFTDWEYIVIDDASKDNTCAIVEAFAGDDARIRLIRRSESGGPFVAANEGLRQARGKYVFGTDADDISKSERFEKQLAFMEANRDIKACTTFSKPMDSKGKPLLSDSAFPPTTSGALKWHLCLCCALNHSSLCIEREAFAQLGWYKELPICEDYRLWCVLARKGWLAVVPELLAYWRIHPGGITKTASRRQMDEIAVDFLYQHVCEMAVGWSKEEFVELYDVRYGASPKGQGLRALARWDWAWMHDQSLSESERRDLVQCSTRIRRSFMRANIRRHPIGFLRHFLSFLVPRP